MVRYRPLSQDTLFLLARVDTLEVEQFAQYEDVCTSCGSPFYGILDESKLTLPLEGVVEHLTSYRPQSRVMLPSNQQVITVSDELTDYEIRQRIVRSGLYSRSQLRGCRLSPHELDVNESSFFALRPKRCDCAFGSEPELNDEELALIAMVEADDLKDRLTSVETEFVSGRSVPNGRRRRSPEAIERRRLRRRCVFPSGRLVVPKVHPSAKGTFLDECHRGLIEIRFLFVPFPYKGRTRKYRNRYRRTGERRSKRLRKQALTKGT